jgi:hypothetical protein
MHKSFFPLFVLSLAGVLSTAIFGQTHARWIGLGAGLLPLVIYHFILLKKKTVSATEVDSIYYFGFLVTVVTLVATALSIGLEEGRLNVSTVLVQFALGLVATGYALFSRLHLLTKLNSQAETDVVDATERLAKSVEKVAEEFDRAGHHVTAFVDLTQQRMVEMERNLQLKYASAASAFEHKLNEAALSFNGALAKTAEESLGKATLVVDEATKRFASAISLVMDEIGRVQVEAEAISFAKAAERIDSFSKAMESSIDSITAKVVSASDASAAAISELTTAAKKTQKLADQIAHNLESLDKLNSLLSTIENARKALSSISDTAANTGTSIASLGEKLRQAEDLVSTNLTAPLSSAGLSEAVKNTVSTLGQLQDAAATILSSINEHSEPLRAYAPELLRQLRVTGETLHTFDSLAGGLKLSMNGFEFLLKEANATVTTTAAAIGAMEGMPAEFSFAVSRLTEGLTVLEAQAASLSRTMVERQSPLDSALKSATSGLNLVRDQVSSLEELGPAAAMVVRQLKALAVSASKGVRSVESSQAGLSNEMRESPSTIPVGIIG